MTNVKAYTIALPDGRDLEVVEAGEKSNPAIIVHNGTPMSAGLFEAHVQDALRKGLRLVSYGRPGYGKSTRNSGRTVASAAQDTADLANAIGIDRFATWGISGGGPHALACAALLGKRVVAAASLAGVAPYDAEGLDVLAGMGEDNVQEFSAAAEGEDPLAAWLQPQVPAMVNSKPEDMASHMESILSDVDKQVFSGAFGVELATLMQDGVRDSLYGWLDDDLAFVKPWGFSPADISIPLQIWQGTHDLMVPFSHGEWLAKTTPQADVHLSDTDGHLTLYVNRVPEVHAWLASHF